MGDYYTGRKEAYQNGIELQAGDRNLDYVRGALIGAIVRLQDKVDQLEQQLKEVSKLKES